MKSLWQPIETAPKDGTAVVLYDGFEPIIATGAFWEGKWRPERGQFLRQPTHWMSFQPPEDAK